MFYPRKWHETAWLYVFSISGALLQGHFNCCLIESLWFVLGKQQTNLWKENQLKRKIYIPFNWACPLPTHKKEKLPPRYYGQNFLWPRGKPLPLPLLLIEGEGRSNRRKFLYRKATPHGPILHPFLSIFDKGTTSEDLIYQNETATNIQCSEYFAQIRCVLSPSLKPLKSHFSGGYFPYRV